MTARTVRQQMDWPSWLFVILAIGLGSIIGLFFSTLPNAVIAIGALAGLGVVIASMGNSDLGLLALVVMTYIRFSDVLVHEHNFPSTAQPFVALLGLALILRWILYKRPPSGWMQSTVLVFAYGFVGLGSLLYAADYGRTFAAVVDYAKDATIAVMVTMLLQRGTSLRRVIWALLATGIFMGSLTVYQQLTGNFDNNFGGFAMASEQAIVGDISGMRVGGPIGDPNFYAEILVVLVPLALERLWSERNLYLRLFAAWAAAVCILSILFSFSRGGFVALVAVLLLTLVRHPPRPFILLLTVAIAIPLLQFVPPLYVDRIATLPEAIPFLGGDVRKEVSLSGRTSEMLVAWDMFIDHPIFGVGLDNYEFYYDDYAGRIGLDPSIGVRAPHDLYLEIAAQTGLVGLLTFGILLWVMFQGLQRANQIFASLHEKDYQGMVNSFTVGMFGYLVASLFLHGAYPRFFWLLFGIALALPQIAQYEKEVRVEFDGVGLGEAVQNGE